MTTPTASPKDVELARAYADGLAEGSAKGRGQFDACYKHDALDLFEEISDTLIQHGEARLDERLRKVLDAMGKAHP